MKVHWKPQLGDLISVPDCILSSTTRRHALVIDVSSTGNLMEVLLEDQFIYIHRDEVLPIIDVEGRWIQFGR